jgi:hypothetical protein
MNNKLLGELSRGNRDSFFYETRLTYLDAYLQRVVSCEQCRLQEVCCSTVISHFRRYGHLKLILLQKFSLNTDSPELRFTILNVQIY